MEVEERGEGKAEGGVGVLLKLLGRVCGPLPEDVEGRVRRLSYPQVEALGEELLAFGTLDDLRDNLTDLIKKYQKDVILVEYSHRKKEVHKIVFDLPEGRGKGTCIWEPLSTWERLFDEEGEANEMLEWYDGFGEDYLVE